MVEVVDGVKPVFDVAERFASLFVARYERFIARAGRRQVSIARTDDNGMLHLEFKHVDDMVMLTASMMNWDTGAIMSGHHSVPLGDPECFDKLVGWLADCGLFYA